MPGLTDLKLRSAKPKAKQYRLTDTAERGRGRLICRVEPTGAKTFFFRYRTAGSDRLVAIGSFDPTGEAGLTLKLAREKAREFSNRLAGAPMLKEALAADKRQVEAQEREKLLAKEAIKKFSLRALLVGYIAHLRKSGRPSASDAESIFARHVFAPYQGLSDGPATEVEARDVAQMLRRLVEAGKARTAGKLRSYLGAAYALALRAETDPAAPSDLLGFRLRANPAAATAARSGVQARHRVLTAAELRGFMKRAESLTEVQRDAMALLLLLGGQRPMQLIRAKVTDADLHERTLMLHDPKGKRSSPRRHIVPLTEPAAEVIARRMSAARMFGSQWLFTSDGDVPVRIETLSHSVATISAEAVKAGEASEPYQLRDLRRTCETMLAGMGVSKDDRAQLLSHGLSGVQHQHYDRHDYRMEKQAVLEAWQRRLQEIAAGTSARVTPIAKRAKRGKA